jgi:hypothetical protein
MLKSEAIATIKRRLGFRSDQDSNITFELQQAQIRLEKGILLPNGRGTFLPWFLVSEISDATTTAGEERVPVPSDFLAEYEDSALFYYDGTAADGERWLELAKDAEDFLRAQKLPTGAPQAYSLSGGYFRLAPVPDDVYTLKIIYYAKGATISSSLDEEPIWLLEAADMLIAEAGRRMAIPLRDTMAKDDFEKDLARETARLYARNEERIHDNRRYVMGGAD